MNPVFEALEKDYLDKGQALFTALTLLEWDTATEAPEESDENTAKMVGVLSDMYFNTYINDDVKKRMAELEKVEDTLSMKEKAVLNVLKQLYDELETIPSKEYSAFSEKRAMAQNIWAKAKDNQDYEAFAPTLKEIIDYKKKFAAYRKKEGKTAYDIMLGDFEPGFDEAKFDEFFQVIKEELVPFIAEITKKAEKVDNSFNFLKYDIEKQKEFCEFLAKYVGFDYKRGVVKTSAHPFTTNFHNKDVRITNHFYEDNLFSAMFSVIHESGHAVYEMQIDDDLTLTLAGTGTSMGMHEAQSRFFENIIGRSEAFWKPIYPKLVETYPEQLKDVSLEQFIQAINKPECSLIRTEADELTYSLHILIRYEIEKLIFEDKITVDEIPEIWNQKYKEYLGVTPENVAEGALQDVHWSCGDFGYFPSYALGSAIGAQIYYYMLEKMPFEKYLEEGNMAAICEFLKEHVHRFGKAKNTSQILMDMTGEDFNPKYYVRYLKEKYLKLYN